MKAKLLMAAACGLLLSGAVQAAELKVLASGAVKEAYAELVPQFEKASGTKVTITWAGTVDIKKKVEAGEPYDVIIIAAPEMDAFTKAGKIADGSTVDLVKSGVGIAIKPGTPKPDLSSGEGVKKALLAAKSVGYSTGPSGAYMVSLFEKMGIADQVKAKITQPGVPVAGLIRSGDAEIGFQQVSELIHEPGIEFLGPIPNDVQQITTFSGGITPGSKETDAAKALQTFLTAKERTDTLKKHGLSPG